MIEVVVLGLFLAVVVPLRTGTIQLARMVVFLNALAAAQVELAVRHTGAVFRIRIPGSVFIGSHGDRFVDVLVTARSRVPENCSAGLDLYQEELVESVLAPDQAGL